MGSELGRTVRACVTLGAALLATLSLGAGTAAAQEMWVLEQGGESCQIWLYEDEVAHGIGRMEADDCSGNFADLGAYSLERDGHTYMFYVVEEGDPIVAGRADMENDELYVGQLIDGQEFTLSREGAASGSTGQAGTGQGEPAPQTAGCVTYYNTSNCARQEDLGIPDSDDQFAYEVMLQPLTRLNLRASPGGAKIGVMEPICVQAIDCQEQGDGTIWCAKIEDGEMQWFIRRDQDTVYAANGCG